MKYFVCLGDGMADYACRELDNKTPLEAAHKPVIDRLASGGIMGLCKTVPDNMVPESDTANLSILGYPPEIYSAGRSPLEAVSLGITLGKDQAAIRANLVYLSGEGEYENLIMDDNTAGEITTPEARELIEYLDKNLLSETSDRIFTGISYRHCFITDTWNGFRDFTRPHDIMGQYIGEYLPPEPYLSLQRRSRELLENHPVNLKRAAEGKKKANSIWLWSPGKNPSLPSFKETFGLDGAVVCAVDLIKGIGLCAGMEVPFVKGATGGTDTDYRAKEKEAEKQFLSGKDLVYLHVEAPDEYGHQGDPLGKKTSIEKLDSEIVSPMLDFLNAYGEEYRILIMPDHYTPVSTRTHARGEVPFIIYDSRRQVYPIRKYTEDEARDGIYVPTGPDLMRIFLEK
ncbi:MAG: cofactor-independent phosphoglycerate mutase [Ruminococcaceae bacterium]|nr:cofactor-independent phosphoglycerate mutase [Oscillospiraceae bacterium]MBQ3598154.1 cofactor-independent phosphoglycerate mutase [Clostridia bacterium]MBR2915111.1 cofactor-independent phosphoglycerate mutase [Clostridia bacterium]